MPYKIKADLEDESWRDYSARCLRMITQNTAELVRGKFMPKEYSDIINPKPEEKRSADEIIGGIKDKIEKMK